MVCVADLLSLTLCKPLSSYDVDIVVGSAQRLGMPLGCGGPHAAFLATLRKNLRQMPGRYVRLHTLSYATKF